MNQLIDTMQITWMEMLNNLLEKRYKEYRDNKLNRESVVIVSKGDMYRDEIGKMPKSENKMVNHTQN